MKTTRNSERNMMMGKNIVMIMSWVATKYGDMKEMEE